MQVQVQVQGPSPPHRPAHKPVPGTLPAPSVIGDAATRLGRAYGGKKIDALTHHCDVHRTGWNPAETDLTPATVASSKFGLLATLPVDGNVLAPPLLVSNFAMPDGSTHDVLIVVTGHDSVYAFDAQNQWNRAGLAFSNGNLSIGIGSHCDNNAGNISGWLRRYDSNLHRQSAFHAIETHGGYEWPASG